MDRVTGFIKAVLAGIMISIGGAVYLSCDNKYVGAFFFSVGLVTVVMFGLYLYTGRIGYVLDNDKLFFADTALSVLGNLTGCLILGLAKAPIGSVVTLAENKLNKGPVSVFVDAVLCGILIFICVDIYKKKNTVIGILLCIPAFILAGFEHSVADMFYFINARVLTVKSVIFILIVILGNAVGGLLFPVLFRIKKKA